MSKYSGVCVCVCLLMACPSLAARPVFAPLRPSKVVTSPRGAATPSSANCTELAFTQRIDHFTSVVPPLGSITFQQRYFIYDKYWAAHSTETHSYRGPIFFYSGNEADVTLYVNNTGLMWENAERFGALLVFAEHRYYGESLPFGEQSSDYLQYLSSEQALADYAALIFDLKRMLQCDSSPVIVFGGSYGGMLASWMRIKYPHIIDGAISASAPIWSFMFEDPPVRVNSFYNIVTRDADICNDYCSDNTRASWAVIDEWALTEEGRTDLTETFHLCSPIRSSEEVYTLAYWIQTAWSYMAMGNYPYPSSYIVMGGEGYLPAYPVCESCKFLDDPELPTDGRTLLGAVSDAMGVYYNYTHDVACYDITGSVNNDTQADESGWNYQYCTELLMPSSSNGMTDMFWEQPFDLQSTVQWCQDSYGVTPRIEWASIEYGGKKLQYASNIVFSNGDLDPWAGTGVLKNISSSVRSLVIEGAAHHLDLMFSNDMDLDSVLQAREFEMTQVAKWIRDAYRINLGL